MFPSQNPASPQYQQPKQKQPAQQQPSASGIAGASGGTSNAAAVSSNPNMQQKPAAPQRNYYGEQPQQSGQDNRSQAPGSTYSAPSSPGSTYNVNTGTYGDGSKPQGPAGDPLAGGGQGWAGKTATAANPQAQSHTMGGLLGGAPASTQPQSYQPPQMSAQTAAGFGMPAGSGQPASPEPMAPSPLAPHQNADQVDGMSSAPGPAALGSFIGTASSGPLDSDSGATSYLGPLGTGDAGMPQQPHGAPHRSMRQRSYYGQ